MAGTWQDRKGSHGPRLQQARTEVPAKGLHPLWEHLEHRRRDRCHHRVRWNCEKTGSMSPLVKFSQESRGVYDLCNAFARLPIGRNRSRTCVPELTPLGRISRVGQQIHFSLVRLPFCLLLLLCSSSYLTSNVPTLSFRSINQHILFRCWQHHSLSPFCLYLFSPKTLRYRFSATVPTTTSLRIPPALSLLKTHYQHQRRHHEVLLFRRISTGLRRPCAPAPPACSSPQAPGRGCLGHRLRLCH